MDDAWSDYFVALAGSTAALTGLLFVAVSINLERILSYPGLPERALESLSLLLATLIVALFGLVPDQAPEVLGIELVLVGVVLSAGVLAIRRTASDLSGEPQISRVLRVVFPLLSCLPLLVGGALIALETGSGLHWVLGSSVVTILAAVSNAWVLLVEILR